MKTPKTAAAIRVTPASLAGLGADRLAGLLLELSAGSPALKRRLRMELAAQAGAAHLALEIDKRLNTLGGSHARVSWRKRGEFITDLEVVRVMIAERLAALDANLALARVLALLRLGNQLLGRVKDSKGELAAVLERAAGDLGRLAPLAEIPAPDLAEALTASLIRDLPSWADWIAIAGPGLPRAVAALVLAVMPPAPRWHERDWSRVMRSLADAAGDVDAYIAATPQADRARPQVGAEIGLRLLAANRVDEARAALAASDPRHAPRRRFGVSPSVVDALDDNPEWEGAYIDCLERSGEDHAAQTVRWASFERTLAPSRLRDIVARLSDFEDVEALDKAFAHAARDADLMRALDFLMNWPALPEAARLILARSGELKGPAARLEGWAGRMRARQPRAASVLLHAAITAAAREGQSRDAIEALQIEAESIG